MRPIILILLLFSFPFISHSQHYKTKNYNIEDGLISSLTYRVLQDSKGFIWVATEHGVSRFDGYNFENFNVKDGLADNFIFDLYEDYKGRIWFLSFTSKLAYYENGNIVIYPFNDSLSNNINKNIPLKIHVDKDENLYVGYRGMNTLKVDKNGNVEKLFLDRGEAMHVSVFENGDIVPCIIPREEIKEQSFVIYEKEKEYIIPFDDVKNYYLPSVCKIDDEKYIFSFIKDLMVVDHGKVIEKKINVLDDLILNLKKDSQKNLWIGTRFKGILAFDSCNTNKENKLQFFNDKMSSVTEDREGNYWFTANGNGIYFSPSFAIKNYKTEDGLIDNALTSILQTKEGEILLSSNDSSLVTIKNEKIVNYHIKDFPKNIEHIDGLYQDSKGNIWMRLLINNKSYLAKTYNGEMINLTVIHGSVSQIQENPYDGHIYISTSINFFRLNSDNTITKILDKKFRVSSMCFSNNKTFIGSREGLFELINGSLHQIPQLKNYMIQNIIESNGKLFISTNSGIIIYQDDTIQTINKASGLTCDLCSYIFKENETTFWVATNCGTNKILFNDTKYDKYSISQYTSKNGLIFDEIRKAVSFNDKAYILTSNGLSVFKEENIKINNIPPLTYITELSVNDSIISLNSNFEFKYNQNNLHFKYIGLSYRSLGKIKYRYKLLGLSDEWDYTKNIDVQYTTLPPGEYEFIVQAENEHGVWSIEPATLPFLIKPPFWETPLFLISSILFLISLIWAFLYIRIRIIKRQSLMQKRLYDAERKALQSQMNPHFIFNALGSIQKFILKKDIKNADKYLTKFANLIRKILKASHYPTISLTDEIEILRLYMDLETRRLDYKFTYNITFDDSININKIQIPVMLIQPFVENSIWHGIAHKKGDGKINLGFKLDGDILETSIIDNGIGRIKALEINKKLKPDHKSEGLSIINERLVLLDIKDEDETCIRFFDLKDDKGNCSGLKVTIRIPIL